MMMSNNLLSFISDLKKFAHDYENDKIRIINKKNIFKQPHLFLYSLLCSNLLKNKYSDIFIETLMNCEKDFPGSSLDLVKNLFKEEIKISENKVKPKIEDLFSFLEKTNLNEDIIETFKQILKFSGPDVNIELKNSKTYNQVIKKNNSFFDINVDKEFYSLFFNKNKYIKRECAIIIIDGFIEKETSLIPALEYAKDNNKTLIIICRGILNSVSTFLKSCIIKNNMTCLVYAKKFDDKDPFFIEDISLCLDINYIRDHSTYVSKIKENINIREVILYPDKIGIKSSGKKIKNKIIELESLKEDNDYLNFRIKRLKNKTVEVYMIDNEVVEGLKYCLTVFNKIAKFGIYKDENNDILPVGKIKTIEVYKKNLENVLRKIRYIHNVKQ